ncbi:MAG: HEAT repeat domain-containing protein [Nostoc sp. DedVER02]|uniref:HEAT repeat domain-containing protein n=1 Tax=unclassified Nostoc TaxID=2593658 RepID=UPI002AD55E71|nr:MULTISPECIES: HEAT repeat domain-containing protein [unclassified Nostoc]MDZ7990313.1 HEAT repeat domain-containing protein [Nostoc sp. DedVER02]MDZ8115995.1 HEAT repeat domain-containing protein [Nostoc sp. DedVER01b]
MSRNIRGDESALENVLSLVEALLQLSVEQDCESKLPLCVVWNAEKLQITGYKSQQTRGSRSKTTEVGTKKEYLIKQIKDAGKTLKIPWQKAQPNVYQKERELDELQTALDWLKELEVREDQKSTKSQGYWKFTLTLKHQTATIKDNLEVVKQKWKEHQKTNLKETSHVQTTDNSFDWQEICGAMLEKHKRLTTNELLFADEEMKFELEEIHVPLALVERNKPKKCSEDISPEQGSRLYEASYKEKQRFEHEAFLEKIIRDGVGKTQGHRISLIGEPGAGKTTQLQTIAFWILDNNLGLPIWISLADLQGKSVENYLLQDWLKNALEVVRVKEEQENAFADLFKNNRVWLLLDAADEMSSLQPLTEISQQLTGWMKNARVVLTCRVNVWEANANALENFETYRLLNFEYPQQVQEFIGRWFHNKDTDKGKRLWQELDKAERQRIQDLVKNPLRLALLCSTWQGSDQGLPETKAGLYQQFVEEFYKWKEKPSPTTEQQQEELNAALGRLAKRAIDQETSRFRLRHKFVREELGDSKQQDSLFSLALKLGWLNEVGLAAESPKEKVYAFYHPTFEEYFAALAIADWDEFLNHVPDNPAQGVYRIFAPQWKEVILLWLGREDVGREMKEEFIQALVEFDDRCGECRAFDRVRRGFYEFRAYFLAAAAVDEWKNSCNADAIVAEIVKWRFGEFKVEQNEWVKFLTPIAEGAETTLYQTNRVKAIAALVELISNPQLDDDTRWLVAESLGEIGSGNQKAINALVELIGKPQLAHDTRRLAAYSLKQIGSGNQKAIDALVELIGKPQLDDSIRRLASSNLGEIDRDNQKAIAALMELIGKPQLDDDTWRQAAESLGQIGSGNQKAIDALVELIGKPQLGNYTQRLAASSLGKIGSGNQEAIDALVELIGKPQLDNSTLCLSAYSLGKIGSGNKKAIDALVELIGKQQLDDYTQWLAASSLGEIDCGNQKAIAALVELISKPQLDYSTRRDAVCSLGQIGSGNQKAIDALVELIGKPQLDHDTRRQAAESLGQIGSGNQKAIDALVELIGKPQLDHNTRRQVAYSLRQIGSGNQKVIDVLVELIGKPQLDYSTQWLAAYSLGQIGFGNQKVIDALIKLICKPQLDDDTRRIAASSLWQIDPGNQKAIDTLVELIGKPQLDYSTRRQVTESLGKIDSGNQKAIDALVKLISKSQLDDYTQWLAAFSLKQIMLEEQMPSVVSLLKDYLSPESYKNDFKRFYSCYEVIWKCAQSMSYPAFYQAWH